VGLNLFKLAIPMQTPPNTTNIRKIAIIISQVMGPTNHLSRNMKVKVIAIEIKRQMSMVCLDYWRVSMVFVVWAMEPPEPTALSTSPRVGKH
jgi:hypothetical protein